MSVKKPLVGRRFFLRAAGVTVALPIFDSLSRHVPGSDAGLGVLNAASANTARPTRMVCIGNAFGFHPPSFFPQRDGKDYDFPLLLKPIAPHARDLTLFSGLDHGTKGGHFGVHSYLSGVRSIEAKGMPEGNISIDQRAAETIGGATRFSSLAVGSEDGLHGGCMMSWTRSGVRVPPIQGPKELFRTLFIDDSGADRGRMKDRSRLQGSILDLVLTSANSLKGRLDNGDKTKLDEYFTSVRDVEKGLELGSRWADIPKPKPAMKEPEDLGLVNDIPVLYDLIALALQTDSTRIATFEIAGGFEASVLGVKADYHGLSHHGQVQEKIDQLVKLEGYQTEQFARFLTKLKSIDDGGVPLLNHTMVLFGSGMGNGNAHTLTNLPIILAGGGFRHGEHRVFPQTGSGRAPLCNLYLSMLQRFGLEINKFAVSSGTLRGLEVA